MSGAAVAVAVVSWNTRELLARALDALAADAEAGRAEVWVVDNGSRDGSPDLVRERFGWATLLEPGANLGFGRAVNAVAERTDTPWVAAANADVTLAPGALEALVAAGEADPRAGVLGPRLLLPDGSTQPSVQPFPTLANAVLGHARLHRLAPGVGRRLALPGHWDPERPAVVDWVTGAFLLVRRATWDAIGGFDPAQWMYAEDIDLCWRASRAGYGVRYVPAATARHEHGAAAAQAFGREERARWVGATYAWMAARRGLAVAWAVAAANAAEATLRRLALTLAARRDPARWAGPRDEASADLALHVAALRGPRALGRRR